MKTMKATKPARIEVTVSAAVYKAFKKKTAEHDMSMSQWIRHQIIKFTK